MEIKIIKINGRQIAEIYSQNVIISQVQDALDLMGDISYRGATSIIIPENCITPEFFDLSTGLAGEILQKFSNYNLHLAIVGDFSKYVHKSMRDFIYESNKHGQINFVVTIDEAISKLAKL